MCHFRRPCPTFAAATGLLAGLIAGCGGSTPTNRGIPAEQDPASDATSSASTGTPWFREVSDEIGVDFVHVSGVDPDELLFPEIIAGGAALLDIDRDGDLDIYLVQSGSLRDDGEQPANRLYRNDGPGVFTDITASSNAGGSGYGIGVAAGDYDNDGLTDLYVTNIGPDTMLRNRGDGTFEDTTIATNTGDAEWGTSAAFLDYDADGHLDLFITRYVDWRRAFEIRCTTAAGQADYCSPNSYEAPMTDVLYRNNGDGTFSDVSVDAGIVARRGNGLGVVCGDFTNDGRIDIFVANDQMENHLWRNNGDGTFTDVAVDMGCAVDAHGEPKAGMGTLAEDVDDDDDLDLLVVNLRAQADSFFRNEGRYFIDDTAAVGLAAVSRPFTRFGVGWLDFNNDGHLDLFQANGRVTVITEAAPRSDDPYAEPNVLLAGNADGRFTFVKPESGVSASLIHTSRAAAFGDLDDDGGIDIVIVNKDGPAYVLHNIVEQRGHWIRFDVRDANDRPALGAEVRVHAGDRVFRRDVKSAYSYCAANDPRVHIGLGDRASVDHVDIRWPDGTRARFGPFIVDRDHVIRPTDGSTN